MSKLLDVPAVLAERFAGNEKAAVLEALRVRLAADHDALEGWQSSVDVENGKVAFHRGLATGFDVALKGDPAPTLGPPPAAGRALLFVEVGPDDRLFGVVGVPVFLAAAVGGVVAVIVFCEPVFGATARGVKKFLFGAAIVVAVLLAMLAKALVSRAITGGTGNPFERDAERERVLVIVRTAIGGREIGDERAP